MSKMASQKYGYRYLYQSYGWLNVDVNIDFVVNLAGLYTVNCRLGAQPVHPIIVREFTDRVLHSEPVQLRLSEHSDPSETHYTGPFVEIVCWKEIEGDPEKIIESLNSQSGEVIAFKKVANLAATLIGLVFHRQLLFEVINAHIVFERANAPHGFRYEWQMDLFEEVEVDVKKIMSVTISSDAQNKLLKSGAGDWLVKAWSERDLMLKFLAFFIPLEVLLAGISPALSEQTTHSKSIRKILTNYEGKDKDALLNYFEGLIRHSLNQRFEALAKSAALDVWQEDIEQFKKLNKIRNTLLHQGKRLETQFEVGKVEIGQIQTLAEKYVKQALFS